MAHSFPIHFDPARVDSVVIAVAPIDAFSGQVVRHKVNAAVDGLKDRPVRNGSGLLVFINLPPQPSYVVRVKAGDAGYFDPVPQTLNTPAAGAPISDRRLDTLLYRKPSAGFDSDTTIVSGMLKDAGTGVDDGRIEAEFPPAVIPPGPPLRPFQTRTDVNGSFLLPLRMPDDAATGALNITFRFIKGLTQRTLVRQVNEGKLHMFDEPIELTGVNTPALLEFGQ